VTDTHKILGQSKPSATTLTDARRSCLSWALKVALARTICLGVANAPPTDKWEPARCANLLLRALVLPFAGPYLPHPLGGHERKVRHRQFTVTRLLACCSPSAVFWRVIPIVVDAVQTVLRGGARSHVCKEIAGIHPALANLDATTAVSLIPSSVRVQASPFHCCPDPVFRNVV